MVMDCIDELEAGDETGWKWNRGSEQREAVAATRRIAYAYDEG